VLSDWLAPNLAINDQGEVEQRDRKKQDIIFFKSGFAGTVQRRCVFKVRL
jgi:hypothetical protein